MHNSASPFYNSLPPAGFCVRISKYFSMNWLRLYTTLISVLQKFAGLQKAVTFEQHSFALLSLDKFKRICLWKWGDFYWTQMQKYFHFGFPLQGKYMLNQRIADISLIIVSPQITEIYQFCFQLQMWTFYS